MINEEISKEAGQAAQTIITYTIKAAKESINLDKEIRKKMNETLEMWLIFPATGSRLKKPAAIA